MSNASKFKGLILESICFALIPFCLASHSALAQAGIQPDTPIPLVAVLWQNTHFGGAKRELVIDTPNLSRQSFNDKTSSVGVHPGPDFATWKANHGGREPTVTLLENAGGQGKSIVLKAGIYSNLKSLGMNDNITSIFFTDSQENAISPEAPAKTFDSIPFVVELLTASPEKSSSRELWLIESTSDISADYGSEFNDSAQQALVITRTLGVTGPHTLEFCLDKFFDRCFPLSAFELGKHFDSETVLLTFIKPSGFGRTHPEVSSVRMR